MATGGVGICGWAMAAKARVTSGLTLTDDERLVSPPSLRRQARAPARRRMDLPILAFCSSLSES